MHRILSYVLVSFDKNNLIAFQSISEMQSS